MCVWRGEGSFLLKEYLAMLENFRVKTQPFGQNTYHFGLKFLLLMCLFPQKFVVSPPTPPKNTQKTPSQNTCFCTARERGEVVLTANYSVMHMSVLKLYLSFFCHFQYF